MVPNWICSSDATDSGCEIMKVFIGIKEYSSPRTHTTIQLSNHKAVGIIMPWLKQDDSMPFPTPTYSWSWHQSLLVVAAQPYDDWR